MRGWFRWFVRVLAVLPWAWAWAWAWAVSASPFPSAFEAEYQLTRNGIPFGTMERRLTYAANDGYRIAVRILPHKVLSLFHGEAVNEEAVGRRIGGRLRPDRYRFERQGSKQGRTLVVEFDWEERRATMLVDDDRPWSMALPADALDKLTQQLAFVRALSSGSQAQTYQVADGGRLKPYSYRVLGRQTLDTALGRIQCIKVSRAKSEQPPDYTLWFAPPLGYLPVRIERQQGGDAFRMEIATLDRH